MDGQYPYEKLGLLYLGRELDLAGGAPSQAPLLYKNKDMTTHAVIIGMTGSGKTGLGIGLIEEAIMDNVPSIVIDPKGDMGNLLLTFPDCAPGDFAPWIDPAEAAKREMSVEQYAAETAKTWKNGLAAWGQGPERIAALRSKTELTIYTPGSSAGVPVSVLGSFTAPAPEVAADIDTLNSLVSSTATSLLALVDITGDPLQSREHILLSSLFLHFWRLGQDLSMESLIGGIVTPPFAKVGVFPLDTFYPQPQRMALAMNLNNILASPSFSAWTEGEPLDIQRILYGESGLPRTAIFSIAHLSDTERMFFVTMLLNQFIGWMRRQQGTASLKALLYMDEIFGYFPPVANPPSKKPMLLLLKQARAYGIGVVLATQNPVDLDYKGLANIGTWFVGRLQTSQDQDRVVEGIAGASDGKLNVQKVRKLLSDMKGRQFLLNSAHLDEPLLFETRWAMSYLKGPISQNDIKKLMEGKKRQPIATQVVNEIPSMGAVSGRLSASNLPPVVAQAVEQRYHLQNVVSEQVRFEPWLAASASVRFFNGSRNIDVVREVRMRLYLDENFQRTDWSVAETTPFALDDCRIDPPGGGSYYPLPSIIAQQKDSKGIAKSFGDYLYQNSRLELSRIKGTAFESRPDEKPGDFKVRYNDYLRQQKDQAVDKLREKYRVRQTGLEQKLNRALDRLDKEKVDVQSKTTDSLISFGVAVVGAFFGKKTLSAANLGRAATGVRSVGRVVKEKSDVKRAEEEIEELRQGMEALSAEIEQKATELADTFDVDQYEVETFTINPRRSDIFDVRVALLWEMVA
ncbi:MAG: DUF87 domain-containing protein [Proteobacteria bacterium]|nr:DUF87 domain-containing protein [Pseudomonadota bacterium]